MEMSFVKLLMLDVRDTSKMASKLCIIDPVLTLWGQDKMNAIFQMRL